MKDVLYRSPNAADWSAQTGEIFRRQVFWTALAHGLLVLLVIGAATFSPSLFKKPEVMIPVSIVTVEGGTAAPDAILPPPVAKPDPVVKKTEIPVPKPEPKPVTKPEVKKPKAEVEKPIAKPKEKAKIERSKTKVTRQLGPQSAASDRPRVSPEDVRKGILGPVNARGVLAENPSEDQLCATIIRQAVYDVWQPPSREETGGRKVRVHLMFDMKGNIVAKGLKGSSGSAALDASAQAALDALTSIPGLPETYLKRNRTVTIVLDVTDLDV